MKDCGYVERRDEVSNTLFFKKRCNESDAYPTLINVFYTNRGVMTKVSHPSSGYNQLWRSTAYDSIETLKAIFLNPRTHTGRGYRSAGKALRGCIKCGIQKQREDYSKNQWRKSPVESKCSDCIQQEKNDRSNNNNEPKSQTTSKNLPILFLGASPSFVENCGEKMKTNSVVITEEDLIQDSSKAHIPNISQEYKGVITTDDWFDVDDEYQPLADSIIRTLKQMFDAGGSAVIASYMGIFSVPRQISTIFELDSAWEFVSYTRKNIKTTTTGKKMLGDIFSNRELYVKANFVQAPLDQCLFVEYIDPNDYEDDSDYDEMPEPDKSSPIVSALGPSGGRLSYFGFVSLDVSYYGDIMMRLVDIDVSSGAAHTKTNDGKRLNDLDVEVNLECIECDADGCTKSGPAIRCDACKMVYYCSDRCKRQHQSTHSDECRFGATMKDRFKSNQEPAEEERKMMGMAAMLAGRRDFKGVMLHAQYFQILENWKGALELYTSVFDQVPERSPPEGRELMMGMSHCFYEIGEYDRAIMTGEYALRMNRHFPQAHKYVALSLKAKGDRVSAIKTMTRAVLYETPWDPKNIELNKALLREIQGA